MLGGVVLMVQPPCIASRPLTHTGSQAPTLLPAAVHTNRSSVIQSQCVNQMENDLIHADWPRRPEWGQGMMVYDLCLLPGTLKSN